MLERIQKIISAAGITSRRAAETLITEGRVRVNGTVVTELGAKADASKDHIKVDGKLINPKQPLTYIMLNKPAGFVTTMSDPEGRPTVQDLLKGVKVRVYPVGRLDYNTEGLLLMTNDGDFAHLITHPKHEFPKTYLAKVKGVVDDKSLNELEEGVYLSDGKTAPARIKKIRKEEANSWLEITIHEGRKRQVRRMFDRIGHSVIRLKRIRTGNLSIGDLPEGSYRHLEAAEVKALREASGRQPEPRIDSPRIAKPLPKKNVPKKNVQKKAHKGKTPDLRPGRAPWHEEKPKSDRPRNQGRSYRSGNPKEGDAKRSFGFGQRRNDDKTKRGRSQERTFKGTGRKSGQGQPRSNRTVKR